MRQLKHLCRDDKTALDAIDRATVGGRGNPTGANQYTEVGKDKNRNNSSPRTSPVGNANTYALRKLRKDRPDLHERVLSEEISPHAAMVEAGFRQTRNGGPPPRTVVRDSHNLTKRTGTLY